MLKENIKKIRENKGLTQEEFAERLNVVRQTVSKWEKGISVPDVEIIQKMSEIFDVPVQDILGAPISSDNTSDDMVNWLAKINGHLAPGNRRSFGILKGICIALVLVLVFALGFIFGKNHSAKDYSALAAAKISDFSIKRNEGQISFTFFTDLPNPEIKYTLIMHDINGVLADETVKVTNQDGSCDTEAIVLPMNKPCSIVLKVTYGRATRNIPIATCFAYGADYSTCEFAAEYLKMNK